MRARTPISTRSRTDSPLDRTEATVVNDVVIANNEHIEHDGSFEQSANYDGTDVSTGDATDGWRREGSGDAEYNSLRARGVITATSFITGADDTVARIRVASGTEGQIDFLDIGDEPRGNMGTLPGGIDINAFDGSGNNANITMADGNISLVADGDMVLHALDDLALHTDGDMSFTSEAGLFVDVAGDLSLDVDGEVFIPGPAVFSRNGIEQPIIDGGTTGAVSTDASADVTVNHFLGVAPDFVQVTTAGTAIATSGIVQGTAHSLTSSSFKIRVWDSRNGTTFPSTGTFEFYVLFGYWP